MEYHDELFTLRMQYAQLNQGLDAMSVGISVVSRDILIRASSTPGQTGEWVVDLPTTRQGGRHPRSTGPGTDNLVVE